jgi:hypothetical protein
MELISKKERLMPPLWSTLTSTVTAKSTLAAKHDAVPISLLANRKLELSPIECFRVRNGGVVIVERSEAMKSLVQR